MSERFVSETKSSFFCVKFASDFMKNIYPFLIIGLLFFASCNTNKNKDVENDSIENLVITLETLDSLIEKSPNNADLYFQRANMRLQQQMLDGAMADMQQVMQLDSSKTKYLMTVSDIYFKMLRCEDAVKIADKAVSQDSLNAVVWVQKGKLEFACNVKDKDNKLAFDYLNKALKQDVNNSNAYFWKGMIYSDIGNFNMAISSFLTATEVDPNNANAFVQLGLLYSRIVDTTGTNSNQLMAISYLTNAIKIDSNNIDALYSRGLIYQQVSNFLNAKIDYSHILSLDSSHLFALYNRAVVNYNSQQFPESLQDFNRTLTVDSTYAIAYFGRAMAFEKMGNKVSAVKDYRDYLKLKPNDKDAKVALEELKSSK